MRLTENDIAGLCGSEKAAKRSARTHHRQKPHRSKILLLLRMIDAAHGEIDASDEKHSLLNYFCGDYEPTDTFNEASRLGYIRVTHNDIFETSTAFLTESGRAALAQSVEKK
ncbi:hypothetical protein [Nitrobacter sp. TKz-YC01]|uniref:hypothetical protein n=1 Tax=Nitrobacter sp. TKz-YC01 TaxID=3398703 RepID=UPI003A100151